MSGDPSDMVARLHARSSQAHEFSIMEKLRSKYAKSPRDAMLANSLDRLIAEAVQRADLSLPAGFGNRVHGSALVVMGPTGVGKSRALARLFKRDSELKGFEDPKSASPLISVSAPAHCTPMQLARTILRATGYPLKRDLPTHQLWELAWERLDAMQKFLLHIDELQHVVQYLTDKDRQEMANTLKHSMEGRRISLILSGVDAMVDFLQFDEQLFRRMTLKPIPPLSPDTLPDLARAVIDYSTAANLEFGADDMRKMDFFARLAHAGLRAFGYSIVLTHSAIERALLVGDTTLTVEHFAHIFAAKTAATADRNPFLAPNWHAIDCASYWQKPDEPTAPTPSARRGRKK
jgi:Bacterial TniB protein